MLILQGEQLRAQALRRGLESSVFVHNVVIKMYSCLGLLQDARKVFDEMDERDLFSWNSLMAGYVGVGDVRMAREVFDDMPERDVVSWSTVIAGYVQEGSFMEAMELFCEMQLAGARPNEFTLTTVLAACSNLVALEQGKWIHMYIDRAKIKMNDRLLAALIDMYSKCGDAESSLRLFDSADNALRSSIRPWNAMLSGFAIHGLSEAAIQHFERMKMENIAPDKVTFVSLLNACSHGRLVDEGRLYFESMKSIHGIDPEIEHYGCMVDLLGRAGRLKEAEEFIESMPVTPDTAIWSALLAACKIHRDTVMADRIGKLVNNSEPENLGCQVLLANIYSSSGRWVDAKDVRKNMGITGRRKTPGCSSIELDGMFHQFFVGDKSHPQTKQIYLFLEEMYTKLKMAGYAPEIGEVLLDIDGEDRETVLSRHSEKLAIAFALMNTPPGTPIRIVKNLRVCGDCHHATKFISKVYGRVIIVRDRIRFHHFEDGLCSCKDYW
ncbi:Tetratricopeptide-like helical domain-containing protein [Dioscorea alata]|uniref:Tetratricopeptide-like helical domain-containing protein n=1 Tax=Dioscorea alata TaxID=55571 RepID=A0ACB7TRP6_DIOAL|nr:Tetratricopeptide-like helical domain-containing protein [Dioscorea alata]